MESAILYFVNDEDLVGLLESTSASGARTQVINSHNGVTLVAVGQPKQSSDGTGVTENKGV